MVCKIKSTNRQISSRSTDFRRDSDVSQGDVNREYYEIADTIYEKIDTTYDDLGMQVEMTNNDAYYVENIQFRSNMGICATNNEAYYMTNVVPMKQSTSYHQVTVGHRQHFPNVPIDADHSNGTENACKLDGTDSENAHTSTATEYLKVTVQNEGYTSTASSTPKVQQDERY